MPMVQDIPLGEALVEQGAISEQQLEQALAEQESSGQALGEILLKDEAVSSLKVLQVMAQHLDLPYCKLRHGLLDFALLDLIGEQEAERLQAIPMFRIHNTLTVAMAQPQSLPKIDRLQELTGCKIRPILASADNILDFVKKTSVGSSSGNADIDSFLATLSDSDVEGVEKETTDDEISASLDKTVEGSPIVNLVNMTMLAAIRDKASDIHIEPEKNGTRIRYRIDGALRDLMKPPPGLHAAIVSRVKVIGKMDIAEKRMPQEGRVRIVAQGRNIDLRVSSMPTLLGEKIVVRLLDKANLKVRLQDLGFGEQSLEAFMRMLNQPYGLVLVTGPTGSGKTTTLYSALDLLSSPERNILTVEDPVEYQIGLINQIQVQEAIGMTFERALRSILRQDPDVIMVGEIRDQETARVAVQAALTGHLVLATLHTNDAPGAVARLLDMGIESYLLSSALNGVVAQRLARTVCPACAASYMPAQTVLDDAALPEDPDQVFHKGLGCKECHNSGFQGRAGIYAVMEVTDEIRRLIHEAAPSHILQDALSSQGVLTLREEGVLLAQSGQTSLEEVLDVTHSEDVAEEQTCTVGAKPRDREVNAADSQLQDQFSKLESDLKDQIMALTVNSQAMQEQARAQTQQHLALQQERDELKQRLEVLTGELQIAQNSLRNEAGTSGQTELDPHPLIAELDAQKEQLQAQVSEYEQRLASLTNELQIAKDQLQQLATDPETGKGDPDQQIAAQEQQQWQQERAHLQQRLACLTDELHAAQAQLQKTERECEQLDGDLEDPNADAGDHNEHLQAQLHDYEALQRQWQQTREDLEQRLDARGHDLQCAQEQLQQSGYERAQAEAELQQQISDTTGHNEHLLGQLHDYEEIHIKSI